jgi:DNA-binding IclR family transcriptional regulator
MASRVGRRYAAYCTTVGKAMMAELPESELDAILRQTQLKPITPRTVTSAEVLKAELKLIRARGYAVNNSEVEAARLAAG